MASVDHFFVFCRAGAPERQLLIERGLRLGVERDHLGQGTRNACFGFADCYLELIWLWDEAAAEQPLIAPLGLVDRMRWRNQGACPFGICLRPDQAGAAAPFASWPYRPPYAPDGMHIDVSVASRDVTEPMLFHVDHAFTPFEQPHALCDYSLHELVVTVPTLAGRSPWHEMTVDGLRIQQGGEHLLEVKLRGADTPTSGTALDLRPALPLTLTW